MKEKQQSVLIRCLFRPSSLIAIVIAIIFFLMAFVNFVSDNERFFSIAADTLKVLAGGLAGAVVGEKYGSRKTRRT